jgi:hypothetical protein
MSASALTFLDADDISTRDRIATGSSRRNCRVSSALRASLPLLPHLLLAPRRQPLQAGMPHLRLLPQLRRLLLKRERS